MKKKVSIFFLITCFTLMLCAGVTSATNNTGMTTQSSNNGSVIGTNGSDANANY